MWKQVFDLFFLIGATYSLQCSNTSQTNVECVKPYGLYFGLFGGTYWYLGRYMEGGLSLTWIGIVLISRLCRKIRRFGYFIGFIAMIGALCYNIIPLYTNHLVDKNGIPLYYPP